MEFKKEDQIRAYILRKLARFRKWGESHTAFDHIQSGMPSHLRDKAKDEGKKLIRDGLILSKSTHYGLEISLNPLRAKEIKDIIKRFYGDSSD